MATLDGIAADAGDLRRFERVRCEVELLLVAAGKLANDDFAVRGQDARIAIFLVNHAGGMNHRVHQIPPAVAGRRASQIGADGSSFASQPMTTAAKSDSKDLTAVVQVAGLLFGLVECGKHLFQLPFPDVGPIRHGGDRRLVAFAERRDERREFPPLVVAQACHHIGADEADKPLHVARPLIRIHLLHRRQILLPLPQRPAVIEIAKGIDVEHLLLLSLRGGEQREGWSNHLWRIQVDEQLAEQVVLRERFCRVARL